MTSIFDQIKADREAGTPGDWSAIPMHISEDEPYVEAQEGWRIANASSDVNARRIARVPQLERIALAAEGFAALAEDMMEDLVKHGGYTFEDDFKAELDALTAFREACK